jgi:hypothetical protein
MTATATSLRIEERRGIGRADDADGMPRSSDPDPQHTAAVLEFGRFVFLEERASAISLHDDDGIELLSFGFVDGHQDASARRAISTNKALLIEDGGDALDRAGICRGSRPELAQRRRDRIAGFREADHSGLNRYIPEVVMACAALAG